MHNCHTIYVLLMLHALLCYLTMLELIAIITALRAIHIMEGYETMSETNGLPTFCNLFQPEELMRLRPQSYLRCDFRLSPRYRIQSVPHRRTHCILR